MGGVQSLKVAVHQKVASNTCKISAWLLASIGFAIKRSRNHCSLTQHHQACEHTSEMLFLCCFGLFKTETRSRSLKMSPSSENLESRRWKTIFLLVRFSFFIFLATRGVMKKTEDKSLGLSLEDLRLL